MKSFKLLLVFLAYFLSGCVHVETPHKGAVKDAETNKPVQGVVAHIDLESGVWAGPDGKRLWKDSYETITDEEGRYSLPLKLATKLPFPLEITNGNELSFVKAGYFPARILAPSSSNAVLLYPIKYYLDYSHIKESAKKGELDPYTMDKKPEAFTQYREELTKMSSMQFERLDDEGAFISMPQAQFTKLYCKTTFGTSGNACIVFDEVSRKMTTFNARGNTKELKNDFPSKYNLVTFTDIEADAVYANSESIYTPTPPQPNMDRNVAPQKGQIIGVSGQSQEFLTLEGDGAYLCYYSSWHGRDKGCISITDVFYNDTGGSERQLKFISIAHEYSSAQVHYYVISKKDFDYQIHKVTRESDLSGKTIFNFSEQFYPSLPADDEIIDFASDGRSFFIGFRSGDIKKYSLDMYGKGPLKEDKAFYDKSHDVFKNKAISAIKFGRSVSDRALYVTVGNSIVYRLSLDGVPDFRIRIKSE